MLAITIILLPVSSIFATPFAYITNQGSHDVSVIDVATDKLINTIVVGKSPAGVVAVSAVGKVFVTNPESRNVSVIAMREGKLIDTLKAGEAPLGIDASHDGRYVFVADWQAHQLLAFDARTHALAWQLALGKAPSGVSAHPDNKHVYVAERDDDQVAVIDIETRQVTQRLKTESHPFALLVDRKGEKLYTLNVWSDSVSVHDITHKGAGKLLANIPVGKAPYGGAESSDGASIFITNQHGESISVIDVQSMKVKQTLKDFDYPEGILAHGNKVYAVNWMTDSVSVFDAATGRRITEIEVGKNPRGFGQFIGSVQSN